MFEIIPVGIVTAILIIVFAIPLADEDLTRQKVEKTTNLDNKDNTPLMILVNASGPYYSINKIKSGLDIFDPLNDGNLSRISVDKIKSRTTNGWVYYGSAFGVHAPVDVYEDLQNGLVIGAAAAKDGQWISHFAMSPDTYASVFHTVMTSPYKSISKEHGFQIGLYVQTTISNGLVNYVSCGAFTSPSGLVWQVVYASGNEIEADEHQVLWKDSSNNQSQTRDCKIITNGKNYLKVYLDNVAVYSNNKLDLKMPPPFNSYLEVTTPSSDQIRYGMFKNYYEANGNSVHVINAPADGSVKIIGESNKVLADAPVKKDGTANLNIIQYPFPLIAKIQVYDSENKTVTSTSNPLDLFGGDIYSAVKPKTVNVINAPADGSVKIIGESNKVLADAPVKKDGTANLNIIQYPFPLIAKIQVYDSENKTVTSTSNIL